jgi:hypothetical protein
MKRSNLNYLSNFDLITAISLLNELTNDQEELMDGSKNYWFQNKS